NTVDPSVNTACPKGNIGARHSLESTHVEFFSDEDEPKIDLGNNPNSYPVPTTPNTRIHKDHPINHVIGDIQSGVQTRRMAKTANEQGFLSAVYEGKTHEDLHTCLFACFLSQEEPKRISKALSDPAWVEVMQEELLQFKLQKLWILVNLPKGHRAIGHTQEEGIDYDEVFAPVARIEAIRLFLAYASFMGFLVYQMDVKSAFLYGQIEEEVYVCQPPRFEDPDYPNKVYKVVKALYGLHQAPRACQDKYVEEILRKFNYTDMKSDSTPVDLEKPLVKDGDGTVVDGHLYRSMIGSLMYLTASRLDIIFAVCACLWYSRDSPFELVAYTDSDYAGATQDRKSTTGGCQFLGNMLISWQCKKQTMVATSTTEAKYVTVSSCCGQVLWIQNQLLDYGYNFMNTVIHIDNNNLLTKGFDAGSRQKCQIHKQVKRGRDTKVPQSGGPPKKVGDEAVHKELGDRMERAATTASSLEAEQDNGSGPRGYTLGSGKDNMKLMELMAFVQNYVNCTDGLRETVSLCTIKEGVMAITATIDRIVKLLVTEASIRRHLNLEDFEGLNVRY
ncbi:putative reverse transcriptase, RNA-dependent DNA polymerase, partial [Tanacetum coccineum]